MTVRSADGETSVDQGRHGERRAGVGKRIQFETLVAAADPSGQGSFEAESVDVSPEGMRLRTAYLPKVGETLVCRFESAGGDVVVQGEVLWRVDEARGGEFALRFLEVDEATAEALKGLCAPVEADADAASAGSETKRGTRVRLHIEGLGSPMKARVRDAADGEVLVGSNLEFLRVGRGLELEDVDHGGKRDAFIDSVRVEVDPSTSVPQLVVALRYGSARERAEASGRTTLPYGARARSADVVARRDAVDVAVDDAPVAVDLSLDPPAAGPSASAAARSQDPGADTDDDDGDEVPAGLKGRGARAAEAGMAMVKRIGPALSTASGRARVAFGGLVGAIAQRRAARAEAKKAAAPKRMTAPPPAGALKSEGRRLVREEEPESEGPSGAPRRMPRKAIVLGGALGLAAVLGVVAMSKVMVGSSTRDTTLAASTTAAAPALAAPVSTGAVAATGPATANVPLFGATPLSTTETVPLEPPAPSGQALAAAPAGDGSPEQAAGEEEPGIDDGGKASAVQGKTEWGNGAVEHPVVLKVKMDGAVEAFNGSSGENGFTITVPSRKTLSAASELARKDKRIASLQAVNNAQGAEITLQFKGDMPGYRVKAKGDKLEIALGTESKDEAGSHKKVASKGKKKDVKSKDKAAAKKKGKKH